MTQANRLKVECEKMFAQTQKAKDFKDPPKAKPKAPKEENLFADFSSGPLGGTSASSKGAARNTGPNLCQCGASEPAYKGYCEDCVKKLKKRFDYMLEKFNRLKAEYDEYNQADLGKADEKMKLLKNKMAQYGAVDANMLDVMSKHEKLMNSDESRAFAEFKVSVQSMGQEIKIIKAKQEMELEVLRKQQNYLDVNIIKQQGKRRDVEAQIDTLHDKTEELKTKQEEMDKLIMLKKRFVLQCTRLKEDNPFANAAK